MADYYPLISRAVAGLEKNTGENRRVLYERARAALLAQLRGVTPSLNESDITRERLALEESIRKVEAEAARQFVEPSRQPPSKRQENRQETRPAERPSEQRSSEARSFDPDEPDAEPPRRYVNPPSPAAAAEMRQDGARRMRPPSSMPDARQSDTMFDRPPADPQASPAPQRHPLRRPPPAPAPSPDRRGPLLDAGLKDFRNVVSEANGLGGASARAEKYARDAYNAVPAAPQDLNRPPRAYDRAQFDRAEPMFEQQPPSRPHEDFSEPMLEPSFGLDDAPPIPSKSRRSAPLPSEEEDFESEDEVRPRRSFAGVIKGLIAAIVIIGIGAVAFWQWPNMVALYRAVRAPSAEVSRDVPSSLPTPSKKIQERVEPGNAAQQQQTAQAPSSGPALAAAVAQKVVLYEEDPDDPAGKRFVGSAIWRTETVTPGPGQPPELAIRADVEVPERKLAMTWSLRRNTDKGLPASHTVEIMFKLPTDFPSGGISNVPGILMKQAESTRGVPLAGLAVKVTNGFYLIGLSAADADKERNLQLLKERAWFDIPVVYNNNRRAILAIEKGTPGERAFAEAFKAWKQ